ncbi:acyltransferase domain-containing protein [Streptomyces albus subsp. chlorinus]|uniref:acyltransferase domain-containing protein n=1 Tax=Streptomyces albus TaxID=1888 RepID=UPI00156FC9B6|nr:acyltransferase domain-containing protein [Streptomyces albus]NSC22208.1 acyltransferase domain-containing protein [Streptomyces albus subsp. chlorinus]
MSVAFLFPGPGSLRRGMLHRLPDTESAAAVLAEAECGHPGGVAQLDTAEALAESEVARHVCLLVAGVAGARALTEDEGVEPVAVAGHGPGSFAAAVTAGLLTLPEALRAVRIRAELLERAEEPPRDLAIRMAQHLATVRRRAHTLTYVTCTAGSCLHGDANGVFDDLARSVALPVRWGETARALLETGADCWVELPPGRALTERFQAEGTDGARVVSMEELGIAEVADFARGGAGEGTMAVG